MRIPAGCRCLSVGRIPVRQGSSLKGNTDMSNIVPMNYDDHSFPFASDCWFNATVAAKHHGKRVKNWTILESTRDYVVELAQELDIEPFNSKGQISTLLIRIEKGRYGGTWMHPELAVEFARWLSVKFARACDRHIKNLLLSKNFQLTEDQIVGLMVCQQPSSWEKGLKTRSTRHCRKCPAFLILVMSADVRRCSVRSPLVGSTV